MPASKAIRPAVAKALASSATDDTVQEEPVLQAWLTTMHADDSLSGGPQTLRPKVSTQQPLLKSLVAHAQGTSAAPLNIGKTLAEGGMGIVKLARQEALGRTVVVKTLRGDYAKSAAEHVLREAWATGALEHPNIVPVHDIRLDDEGAPVIVLQRIEGETWGDLMHAEADVEARFGETDLLGWNLGVLRQVCQALRYAHSRGILHRDLKPDNVMIGAFGEVYLVDWGIALSLGENVDAPLPHAKDASSMAGTPCYMAPEMLGETPLDERTDVYLLGAVLVEILTGQPPHNTDSLHKLLNDVRASTPKLPDDAPAQLRAICQCAMAANPDDRYDSVDDFLEAILTYLQTRGSQALADEAQALLLQLEEILSADDVNRHKAYRLYGALRFGFKRALDTWKDNPEAQRGADKGHIAMSEYELSQGHPRAAAGMLEEMIDEPADLMGRIEVALKKQEAEQSELAKFRDDASETIGRKTRVFLVLILGLLWTGTPLAEHFTTWGPWRGDPYRMIRASLIVWAVAMALWFWARESLSKTELNRRLSISIFSLFPLQILFYAGTIVMDLPAQSREQILLFFWTVTGTYSAALIEKKLTPIAVGFASAFLLAVYYPDQRFLFMAAATTNCFVTGLVLWSRAPQEEHKA